VDRGVYPLSLCEYISRSARKKILRTTLRGIARKRDEEKKIADRLGEPIGHNSDFRKGSAFLLAEKLDCAKCTINQWLNDPNRHPCNENMEKILKISFEYDVEQVLEILEEDLASHRLSFDLIRYQAEDNYAFPLVDRGAYPHRRVIA